MGDIPVRVGERVTRSTMLTTIEDNAGLEVYINVPVAAGASGTPGLPVQVLSGDGSDIVD